MFKSKFIPPITQQAYALLGGRYEWERKDCAVRAVTVVTKHPYNVVHDAFTKFGRKVKRATPGEVSHDILTVAGYTLIWMPNPKPTVERFLSEFKGEAVVNVRGHLFAAKEGQIIDIEPVRRLKRVQFIYVKGESE